MSIHEVHFDDKGNITSTKCLDSDIQKADEGTTRGEAGFPTMQDLTPVPMHLKPSKEYQIPKVVRRITAISKDSVREEEFVMAFNGDGEFAKVKPPSRVYVGEEINQANLRIGNQAFVYSETDVYIAPKRPSRFPVLEKLINIFHAA